MITLSNPKRQYIAVNLPREYEPFLNELLEKQEILKRLEINHSSQSHSGLGKWIIEQYLIENTRFRFKHINTREKRITIYDKKLKRYIDLYPKEPNQLLCDFCGNTECEHVNYAWTIPEVRETLAKKGWEIPDL